MIKRQLNSTAALTDMPIEANGREHSLSVRKIDNGYLTRRSTYTSAGEYKSSECFSKKPPEGFADREARRGKVGSEGLADTKVYLGKDI